MWLMISLDSGRLIVLVIGMVSRKVVMVWVCCVYGNYIVRYVMMLGKKLFLVMLRVKCVRYKVCVLVIKVVVVEYIF